MVPIHKSSPSRQQGAHVDIGHVEWHTFGCHSAVFIAVVAEQAALGADPDKALVVLGQF